MSKYECLMCGNVYEDEKESSPFEALDSSWACPICGAAKSFYKSGENNEAENLALNSPLESTEYLSEWKRYSDEHEPYMHDIHTIAETKTSIIEAMNLKKHVLSFDDIQIKGAQLAKFPLNKDEAVNTRTIIGKNAKVPLVIETPIIITHMSFGALSAEAKTALSIGSSKVKTAICSGEGGVLEEERKNAYKYIFEYVPNKYSATDDNLKRADAIEIKIGQGTKPGMGGHLPGDKVTEEIAKIRGFEIGQDIISPSRFKEIKNKDDLKSLVCLLKEKSGGKPVGIKIAAGHIEEDLETAVYTNPDFITIDGRGGATGASGKFVKESTSVPTIFALSRARQYLDKNNCSGISLIITGGLRTSSDFAKALAMGADALAIGSSALMAIGCQRYRVCNSGKCPVGIATQNPELRKRFDIEKSSKLLSNFLEVSTNEIADFARLTGNDDIHKLSCYDLCTSNSEISNYTKIEHV